MLTILANSKLSELGLNTAYGNKLGSSLKKWTRMIMALAFLKLDDIDEV
jgi:hypothetical protein